MIAPSNTHPSGIRRHAWSLLLLLACSLVAVLPLIVRGPSCGHDFNFHLLSWMETAHDWHHHLLDPRWLATANYGAGEPRFIFYPPLSWMLGALAGGTASVLAGQIAGWTLAPILFTFLSIFGAGVCVYLLAQTLASRAAAMAAACLFIANPYLLFVAYERTAYGELLATPLIALLLLFSLRKTLSITPLALVIAALWLTNAPAAVMGCYTLALVCVLRMVRERHWMNALRAVAGCILGLALAGFYLVPAIFEQRWVQIGRAIDSGMRVEDSFIFRYTGQPYHDQVLRTASILTVILVAIGCLAAIVIAIRKQGVRKQNRREPAFLILGSLLGISLLLQFPFSLPLWHAVPHLRFLQFPWRWLLVASVVSACLLAMAIDSHRQQRLANRLRIIIALLVVFGSVWLCSQHFYIVCDDQDRIPGQLATFHDGAGVEGTDEYTSVGADNSAIFQDLPQVRLLTVPDAEEPESTAGDNPEWPGYSEGKIDQAAGTIAINKWQPESRQIKLTTTQPAFAVLALMDYPAWKVTVNGHAVANRPKRDDGLMTVPIEAGASIVVVQWSTTTDIVWGRVISLLAMLVLAMLFVAKRKSRQT